MDELLAEQHAQEGTDNLSEDQLQSAVGGILSFLKTHNIDLDQIKQYIPNADSLIDKAETENASRAVDGGEEEGSKDRDFMSSAMGFLANAAGGQSETTASGTAPVQNVPQLIGYLSKAGVDPKIAMMFLPIVADFLKKRGIDITPYIGGSSGSSSSADAAPAAAESGTATVPPVEAGTDTAPPTTSNTSTAGEGDSDAASNIMDQAQGLLDSDQAKGFLSSFTKN